MNVLKGHVAVSALASGDKSLAENSKHRSKSRAISLSVRHGRVSFN
jgi:hypothetical protein